VRVKKVPVKPDLILLRPTKPTAGTT
jgi:hypothetical protein